MQLSVGMRAQVAQAFVTALEEALAPLAEDAVSLAALEAALETAIRQAGATSLTRLVAAMGTGYAGPTRPCGCGGQQTTDHYATTTRQTVLGTVAVRRAAYRCATCGCHECPLDARLDLPPGHLSTRLTTRLGLLSALLPFADARAVLAQLSGVEVSTKTAQVVSEALGATVETAQATAPLPPAHATPPPTRVYLGLDGVMYCTVDRDADGKLVWREAKVGVFYEAVPLGAPGTGTRSRLAPDGLPIDVAAVESHSYVVHMGSWQALATKVWQEGLRRGLWQAREIIVLSDGAEWIRSLVAEILRGVPGEVIHILDLRHAEQHLWAVAHTCLSQQAARQWVEQPLDDLRQGRIPALVAAVRALPTPTEATAKAVATTATYYEQRREQMAYPAFRAQGMHIGSGLAESACKRLVGQRAKGPGMHWTVAGAQAIGTLRAAYLSRRWDEVEQIARAA